MGEIEQLNRARSPSLAVGLIAHAATFGAALIGLAPGGADPWAWLALYAVGPVAMLALPEAAFARHRARDWGQVLLYSTLLAGIFFGADHALAALDNAVKPRAALPWIVHGLSLHLALLPGLASVACAALGRCALDTAGRRSGR